MWTKIISHRLAFLVGVLVTAVVLAVLVQAKVLVVAEVCAALLFVLWLGLPIAGLIALNARHPETFLVRDGAFTTPPNATAVLSAGMFTVMPMAVAALAVTEGRFSNGVDRFKIAVVVLLLLLLPLQWYSVLGPFGVFLRPDGVLDRQPFGSIFVPWDAVPAAQPTSSGIMLRIVHPELVIRRGFRPGTTIRTGADRGFTAWAINLYAARPDYLHTIGTDEGLLRLKPR
ncbi:hypothetical protein [Actinoplanes subtropicus]|uniref:hypothetical protein n=1 Tax=Actinoplanes subtropicus TaxID=543632 RepID=UPI0004C473EC|nr:hypothetical protein [Actinoplanes subtropicus]